MKNIRINNDIAVKWTITTNGENESLEGKTLALWLISYGSRTQIKDFTIVGNVVRFVFRGSEQKYIGDYSAVLQDVTGGVTRTVDVLQVFTLVRHTAEQNGADDSNITTEAVE